MALQLGGSDQNLDLRTALTHSSPDADSAQDIRNVAAENARLVFKGRIDVPQLGQRTNADQLCRSLVLDDGAAVDAMPSLEIVADDVKCTHGATVADLDDAVDEPERRLGREHPGLPAGIAAELRPRGLLPRDLLRAGCSAPIALSVLGCGADRRRNAGHPKRSTSRRLHARTP